MVEFHVLRCAICQTFQVLQVTKSQKWKCKLCGEKQSVLKEYGRGTGADCRRHVQKLNTLRGEMDAVAEETTLNVAYNDGSTRCPSTEIKSANQCQGNSEYITEQNKSSRWETFLEKENGEDDEGHHAGGEEENEEGMSVTTDWSNFQHEEKQAKKNKRKLYSNHNRSKFKKSFDHEDDEDYSSLYKTNEKTPDWKQDRSGYRSNGRFGKKWKQSKINSENDTISSAPKRQSYSNNIFMKDSSVKHMAGVSSSLSQRRKVENCLTIGLQDDSCANNSDDEHGLNQNLSINNNVMRSDFNHPKSRSSSSTAEKLKDKNKSSSVNAISNTNKPLSSSKWSTFMTTNDDDEEEEEPSDDDDNDDNSNFCTTNQKFTNNYNLAGENVVGSVELISAHATNNNSNVRNSKWSTFVNKECDNDYESTIPSQQFTTSSYNNGDNIVNSSKFQSAYNSHTNSCMPKVSLNSRTCFNTASNKVNVKEKDDDNAKNVRKNYDSDNFSYNSFHKLSSAEEVNRGVPTRQYNSVPDSVNDDALSVVRKDNKKSLFQLGGDDDGDVWDLDL